MNAALADIKHTGLEHFQWHVETPSQEKVQLAFSMRDPLIMATVLAMAGIYSALDGTLRDTAVELEAWRQKGLAIQQINRHLQSDYPKITDSIIASLATLISIMVSLSFGLAEAFY